MGATDCCRDSSKVAFPDPPERDRRLYDLAAEIDLDPTRDKLPALTVLPGGRVLVPGMGAAPFFRETMDGLGSCLIQRPRDPVTRERSLVVLYRSPGNAFEAATACPGRMSGRPAVSAGMERLKAKVAWFNAARDRFLRKRSAAATG